MITVAYRDFRTSAAATAVLYVLPSDLHATGEHCFRGHHASVLHCHRLLHRTSAMPEIRTLGSVRKTTPVAASDFYPSSAQRFGTEDDASCCKKKKLEARKKKIGGCGLMRAARDVQISILRPPQRVSRSKQGT